MSSFYIETTLRADLFSVENEQGDDQFRLANHAGLGEIDGSICVKVSGRHFDRMVQFLREHNIDHRIESNVTPYVELPDGTPMVAPPGEKNRLMETVLRPPLPKNG